MKGKFFFIALGVVYISQIKSLLLPIKIETQLKTCLQQKSSFHFIFPARRTSNLGQDSNEVLKLPNENSIKQIISKNIVPFFLAFSVFTLSLPSNTEYFNTNANAAVAPLADVGLKEFLVKDGNEFLRLSLPTSQPISADPEKLGDVGRTVQQSVELVRLRLEQVGFSGKPAIWNAAVKDVYKARSLIETSDMLKNIPPDSILEAKKLIEKGKGILDDLLIACRGQDISSTLKLQEEASSTVYDIRALSVPSKYLPYSIPSEFSNLPQLRGRATVECTVQRPSGKIKLDTGKEIDDIKLTMVIDGYHAPITGGNFLDLVLKKHFDGQVIATEELIVQSGKKSGYIDEATKEKRIIPLELFYKGDSAPTYSYTSDEDLRATESFVLPFQAYGALGMEHDDEDPNSGSSLFWFLKWSQALIAPSRNTLDGSHACFGYVTKNQDLLSFIKDGDKIVKMSVTKGAENLFINGKSITSR